MCLLDDAKYKTVLTFVKNSTKMVRAKVKLQGVMIWMGDETFIFRISIMKRREIEQQLKMSRQPQCILSRDCITHKGQNQFCGGGVGMKTILLFLYIKHRDTYSTKTGIYLWCKIHGQNWEKKSLKSSLKELIIIIMMMIKVEKRCVDWRYLQKRKLWTPEN